MISKIPHPLCQLTILVTILFANPLDSQEEPKTQADLLLDEALELGEGRMEEAAEKLRTALGIYEQSGNRRGQAHAWLFLATIAEQQGDLATAGDDLQEAVPLLRSLGDELGLWLAQTLAAEAHLGAGRFDEAGRSAEEAVELVHRLGQSEAPLDVGTLMLFAKQRYCPHAASWGEFSRLPQPLRTMAFRALETLNWGSLAVARRQLGELEAALDAYRQLLELPQPQAETRRTARRAMAEILLELGRTTESRERFREVLKLTRDAAEWREEAEILKQLAALERGAERPEEALRWYEQLLELAEVMVDEPLEAEVLGLMGENRKGAP
jgi:tetratricopeptide (TPR) repeat protein